MTFIFGLISCDVLAVVRAEELRTELKESGVAEGRERADSAASVSSGARFGDHDVLFVAYLQHRSVKSACPREILTRTMIFSKQARPGDVADLVLLFLVRFAPSPFGP